MAVSYTGLTRRFAGIMTAAAFSLAAMWSATADANPVLRISDSTVPTTVDIVDGSGSDLAILTPGTVSALYTSAVFGTDIEIGTSSSTLNPPSIFQTIQFNASSNDAGTLTISISEQDLTVSQLANAFLNIGGTSTAGNVSYAAYIDAGNALFGTGTTLFSSAPLPVTGFAFSASDHELFAGLAGPFSVTLEVTIVHETAGLTTGNADLTLLPEPMTTALLGLGLLGAGMMRRRAR